MPKGYVIGIDIGTGSARAGVFDYKGKMMGSGVVPIKMWRPKPDYAEQSSEDIWACVCKAVRHAVSEAKLKPADIGGIAFDATCSLVAIEADGAPVTVSPSGSDEQNVVVWMDHRAIEEAGQVTKAGHEVLRYLGGIVSPEHQIPKLIWLRKHMPKSFARAAFFMDLADWLTYHCTGIDMRSLCTTVCKWTYLAHEKSADKQWHRGFFKECDLTELLTKNKIGADIVPMGRRAGALLAKPAADLGLAPGTSVAVGIIDAHAGGLGVLGMGAAKAKSSGDYDDVLALIGGTSSCHMVVSHKPRFVRGVWGPYYSAMLPDYWLNEGGQSATGALLDHIIRTHPMHATAKKEAEAAYQSIYEFLNAHVAEMAKRDKLKKQAMLTQRLHMLPYFHGNRSPNADPAARGAIHGLTLNDSMDEYARLYYATIQAVAYGTRDIIEALNAKGYSISRIHACGGGTKNPLWIQEHADVTGCEIRLPNEPEAVLLGSAILAAVGTGKYHDIEAAMAAMSAAGETVRPDKATAEYHGRKMEIHRELYRQQKACDKLMDGGGKSRKK